MLRKSGFPLLPPPRYFNTCPPNTYKSGFTTTCSQKENLKFPLWAANSIMSVKANSVLKAVQASYATSAVTHCNGGPAQTDETADELWYRQKCCDENKGSYSSLRGFGLHERAFERRVVEEMVNEVYLLYIAIYFRGKVDGYFAVDKNPSEHSNQVASGHTVIDSLADNKRPLVLLFFQSNHDMI